MFECTALALEREARITFIDNSYVKFIDESTPEFESMHMMILCCVLLKQGITFVSEL